MVTSTISPIEEFHALHEKGCFVIPNPWDIGSAKILEHLGFKALATTSAGFAFSQGLPDTIAALDMELVIAHTREIVSATSLPVNADFQNGYADSPDKTAENVKLCVKTGVAGISIEDATGDESNPLYERELAIEKIKAARKAIDLGESKPVLTARCEAYLVGVPDAFKITLDRLVAYADAGADCLFAPMVSDPKEIEAIVKSVVPKPVNVIISNSTTGLTVKQLADLGVRRISVGSALARTAYGAFINSAKTILDKGTFDSFSSAASFAEMNEIFSAKK
jgi:2-methylisocitrate lyase-like PEP mutase family enzyme